MRLGILLAFRHEAVFRSTRERLTVFANGFAITRVLLAFLYETRFRGSRERLALFANGLGFAGLGQR
jgi:hypothetical protein